MPDLVDRLKAIQEAHRWTDDEIAKRCGMSRPMWSAVKSRQARMGHRALRPILRNFPELKEDVFAYMVEGDEEPAVA